MMSLLLVCAAAILASGARANEGTPRLPPVTKLAEWSRGNFYSAESRAAFTLVCRSPLNRAHFRAFGVDVTHQRVVFNIELTSDAELVHFGSLLDKDILRLATVIENAGSKFSHGGLNDVRIPPPPPPPPGGDIAAQLISFATASIRASEAFMAGGAARATTTR
jgi:hypothetical protein